MKKLQITDVEVFLTAPHLIDLVVVRVKTNVGGLYGLGCATFTQRIYAVKQAIEHYLKPFLIGKDPSNIEDIWQSANVSGYWRNGPVMNNALSGIDMALWDIKGKVAELPLYDLLGGKSRDGVALYVHTDGATVEEVEESVKAAVNEGFQYTRCQMGMYGGAGTEDTGLISMSMKKAEALVRKRSPEKLRPGQYFDPEAYAKSIADLFKHLRTAFGNSVEFIHDIHERIPPIEAIRLAKKLEPYDLFFLEDPFAPEHTDWLKMLREQVSTPIAMGELFSHPNDWKALIANKQIDFIRAHVSAIGGITPARKLAIFGELFGIRTAWHGPGDLSPIGAAANIHLDFAATNLGIQEWTPMNDALKTVFPGGPIVQDGYAYVSDRPGLGIDFIEEEAKKYPPHGRLPEWTLARTPDGTAVKP
ncbi:mannonate dehydratase [Evansella caseinilytica]|uniref:Mannonate dehydratase n=1 Tax=Evansella caseinilytica TaxID=1503961 RepID=A0A1H3G9Q3_9BACI|nr:enolase C-terminal domain-like protein [Evansella caseinilytica]SDX99214.1 mannonate dehydratase [Evansella caseinilytica]